MTEALTMPATVGQHVHSQLPDVACVVVPGVRDVCQLGTAAETAAGAARDTWLEEIADSLIESLAAAVRMVMTWWTTFPSPQLATAGGQPAPVLAQIRDYTSGLQVVLLTVGIMFAAVRLALAKRGAAAGEAQESFLMLARATFAAMTFGALITVATNAGDQFASWVIFDATRGDLDTAVGRLASMSTVTQSALGAGFLLVLGLLGLICMLIQLVMLVVRQALLVVVMAVIPMAAAASGTGPGSQAYKRMLSWSLAFVLWKPVGALVYALAFTAVGTEDQNDPHMVLLGLILMLMSVIVLPALIRLVTPAVSALGGGGGSAAVLAGAGAGIAMSAVGSRPQARKMTEGENSATPPGSAGAGGSTSPPPGGGGRSMTASSGSSSAGPSTSSGGGGQSSAGSAATGSGAGTSAKSAGSGGPAAAGAMGAGPAGAAMLGAQVAASSLQQLASAAHSAVPQHSSEPIDLDALGPGEVRR